MQTPAALELDTVGQSSLIAEKMGVILSHFCQQIRADAPCPPDAVDLCHMRSAGSHPVGPTGAAADQNCFDLLRMLRKGFSVLKVMILANHNNAPFQVLIVGPGVDYFVDKSLDFNRLPEMLLVMFDLKATVSS